MYGFKLLIFFRDFFMKFSFVVKRIYQYQCSDSVKDIYRFLQKIDFLILKVVLMNDFFVNSFLKEYLIV